MYTPQHISKIINANLVGESNQTVKHLLIDSRQLTEPAHSIFVALKSERNEDGTLKFAQVFIANKFKVYN